MQSVKGQKWTWKRSGKSLGWGKRQEQKEGLLSDARACKGWGRWWLREQNRIYFNLEHLFYPNNLKSRLWSKFLTGITQISISNPFFQYVASLIYLFLNAGYISKAQHSKLLRSKTRNWIFKTKNLSIYLMKEPVLNLKAIKSTCVLK